MKAVSGITDPDELVRTFWNGIGEPTEHFLALSRRGVEPPDYLITRDFFGDLKRCLLPDGIAVFNTFADLEHPVSYAHLLATLREELPHMVIYRPDWPGSLHVNSFIVAAAAPLPDAAPVELEGVPPQHAETLQDMLRQPIALNRGLLKDGEIVTDARNRAVHDIAGSQVLYRRAVVGSVPAAFLVN